MSETNKENKVNENGFGYSSKKVWSVPPKCVLVCKNKLTGHTYSKGKGLQINFPFVRAKLIDVTSKIDDNNKVTGKCLDGFDVTINTSFVTSITDAVRYEFKSKNPDTELKVKIRQVLRKLIAHRHYENLVGLEINLNDPRYAFIKKEFDEIKENYGLRLETIYIRSVEKEQKINDAYEKVMKQKKENERNLLEAENKKKVAELEAEAEKAKLRAIKEVTMEFITELQDKGLSGRDITNVLAYTGTRSENDTRIIALGNGDSKVIEVATAGAVLKKTK